MPVTIEARRNRLGAYETEPAQAAPEGPQAFTEPPPDIGKPQAVRLADIAVFGPMMVYAGLGKKAPRWVRWGLVIVGVGTIIYNFHYYMVNRRAEREAAGLEGLNVGPWHQVADQRRPGQLRAGR